MGWWEADWEMKGKVTKWKRIAVFRRLTAYCQGTENPNIESLDYFAHTWVLVEVNSVGFKSFDMEDQAEDSFFFFFLSVYKDFVIDYSYFSAIRKVQIC